MEEAKRDNIKPLPRKPQARSLEKVHLRASISIILGTRHILLKVALVLQLPDEAHPIQPRVTQLQIQPGNSIDNRIHRRGEASNMPKRPETRRVKGERMTKQGTFGEEGWVEAGEGVGEEG